MELNAPECCDSTSFLSSDEDATMLAPGISSDKITTMIPSVNQQFLIPTLAARCCICILVGLVEEFLKAYFRVFEHSVTLDSSLTSCKKQSNFLRDCVSGRSKPRITASIWDFSRLRVCHTKFLR